MERSTDRLPVQALHANAETPTNKTTCRRIVRIILIPLVGGSKLRGCRC